LCQITSNPYGDPAAEPLDTPDFERGGLLVPSFARPGKLFTAHCTLLVRSVGKLNAAALQRILDAVVAMIRPGGGSEASASETLSPPDDEKS
jgi:mRNA interferase MazF